MSSFCNFQLGLCIGFPIPTWLLHQRVERKRSPALLRSLRGIISALNVLNKQRDSSKPTSWIFLYKELKVLTMCFPSGAWVESFVQGRCDCVKSSTRVTNTTHTTTLCNGASLPQFFFRTYTHTHARSPLIIIMRASPKILFLQLFILIYVFFQSPRVLDCKFNLSCFVWCDGRLKICLSGLFWNRLVGYIKHTSSEPD